MTVFEALAVIVLTPLALYAFYVWGRIFIVIFLSPFLIFEEDFQKADWKGKAVFIVIALAIVTYITCSVLQFRHDTLRDGHSYYTTESNDE